MDETDQAAPASHDRDMVPNSTSAPNSSEEDEKSKRRSPKKKRQHKGGAGNVDDEGGENEDTSGLIKMTASDSYFTFHHTPQQTSNNIFSDAYPPLTQEEYVQANPSSFSRAFDTPALLEDPAVFQRFAFELEEGFNLIFYGFGSKQQVLNNFAREVCSTRGQVVIANAFRPDFTIKVLLNTIEQNVPGLSPPENSSSSVDSQAMRIYDFFSVNLSDKTTNTQPPLYLIIHNIDSPPLRAPKAKYILSFLALCPSIHIAASIDHLNAPLLYSSRESFARKHAPLSSSEASPSSTRGFNWLWHDLTTLQGYDAETLYADRSSISGLYAARKTKDALAISGSTIRGAAITETAALHILASVTDRAKKLFALMARKQLVSLAAARGQEGKSIAVGSANDMKKFAITYDMLYKVARDDFIVTSDTALQASLGEFRDHGLVLTTQGGGLTGELLWIPLRKERLTSVLASIEQSA